MPNFGFPLREPLPHSERTYLCLWRDRLWLYFIFYKTNTSIQPAQRGYYSKTQIYFYQAGIHKNDQIKSVLCSNINDINIQQYILTVCYTKFKLAIMNVLLFLVCTLHQPCSFTQLTSCQHNHCCLPMIVNPVLDSVLIKLNWNYNIHHIYSIKKTLAINYASFNNRICWPVSFSLIILLNLFLY